MGITTWAKSVLSGLWDRMDVKKTTLISLGILSVVGLVGIARPDLVDWALNIPEKVCNETAISFVQKATVFVDTEFGSGTGVTLNRGGSAFVLTAAHVVAGNVAYDGTNTFFTPVVVQQLVQDTGAIVGQQTYLADIVVYSPAETGEDIALLRVRKNGEWPASIRFGIPDVLPIGTRLLHVGCLAGIRGQNSFADGLLAQTGRWIDGREYDQTTLTVLPGSSGGGVFDLSGNYVGMILRWAAPGTNFMSPMRRIVLWAKQNGLEWLIDPDFPVPSKCTRHAEIGVTVTNW